MPEVSDDYLRDKIVKGCNALRNGETVTVGYPADSMDDDPMANILRQRGSRYNPNPARRFSELEIAQAMEDAIAPLLPAGTPCAKRRAIGQMLLNAARAIEGGLEGVYWHDNAVDFEGYYKVLVGIHRGIPPEQVDGETCGSAV